MIWAGAIIILTYAIVLIANSIKAIGIPVFSSEKNPPKTTFSVVVPFRNEASRIGALLNSLKRLDYPKTQFELIFVDDVSGDNSVSLIHEALKNSEFNYRIITAQRTSGSPKKDAITTAISMATSDWIVTTDADCIVPTEWLSQLDSLIQKNEPVLVAGPVQLQGPNTLIATYQKIEVMALQALTMAGFAWSRPYLSNGANMAFRKDIFAEVDGYSGNNHLASGDDVFLLEKIQTAYPDRTAFLKSPKAIVSTGTESKWSDVIRQRIRWASKTTGQQNLIAARMGGIMLLTNLWWVVTLIWLLFEPGRLVFAVGFIAFKFIVDLILVLSVQRFFGAVLHPLFYVVNGLLYPFITLIVAFGSLGGNYQWKGRKYRQQR